MTFIFKNHYQKLCGQKSLSAVMERLFLNKKLYFIAKQNISRG